MGHLDYSGELLPTARLHRYVEISELFNELVFRRKQLCP